MLDILYTSREFTDIEQYLLTISSDIKSMKNVPDGTEITITGILLFMDDSGTNPVEIMSVITPDLECFAFQSNTLKRTIMDINAIYKGAPFTIIKTSGTTNAGRKYINAKLKVDIEAERRKRVAK